MLIVFVIIIYIIQWVITDEWIMGSSIEKLSLNDEKGILIGTIENIEWKNERQVFTIKTNKLIFLQKEYSTKYKIIVYFDNSFDVAIGNVVKVQGTFCYFSKPTNPGQFNEYEYYHINQFDGKMFGETCEILDDKYNIVKCFLYNVRNNVKETFYNLLPSKEAGIMTAMLLGDTSDIDKDVKLLYQVSGIAHVLSISGLHVSIIGMGLFAFFRWLRVNVTISGILIILFLILYYILSGQNVATFRALIMIAISLTGKIIGRTYDMLTAITVSSIIIILSNTLQIFNIGFLLSILAVLGIAIIIPAINESIEQLKGLVSNLNFIYKKELHVFFHNFIWDKVWEGIKISLAAQITTLPIILTAFYETPLYSVLINVIVVPLMSLLVPMGLIAGICGSLSGLFHIVASIIMWIVYYILQFSEKICMMIHEWPYANIVTGKVSIVWIILYYIIVASTVIWVYYRYSLPVIVTITVMFMYTVLSSDNHLKISFIDVGQGDGIYIESPTGVKYLIDGGSTTNKDVGKYILLPFLKSKGVSTLDYVIITHSDTDHISGILQLMDSMKIKNILIPKTNFQDDNYLNIINEAKAHQINVMYVNAGDQIRDGLLLLECIHPSVAFDAHDANAYSTVMSLTYREFSWLFTGDLGKEQENLIMDSLGRYTGLKVGHHGSKNSSSREFVHTVSPQIAIISAGRNNRYGHPHQEVLDILSTEDVQVLSTMESGAITIYSNGKKVWFTQYIQ